MKRLQHHANCVSRSPVSILALALWLVAGLSAPHALGVTFTNNSSINESDTTYDGQDIIVDGATVTIDGPHSFNSARSNCRTTHCKSKE